MHTLPIFILIVQREALHTKLQGFSWNSVCELISYVWLYCCKESIADVTGNTQ